MNYQNGWTWHDSATAEQMENPTNKAACDRLAQEAASIYNSIPEIRSNDPDDWDDRAADAQDAAWECECDRIDGEYGDELTPEQLDQVKDRVGDILKEMEADKRREQWGQIEAIEELLGARGARFCRPYEHFNEDEKLMEYLDNRDEY